MKLFFSAAFKHRKMIQSCMSGQSGYHSNDALDYVDQAAKKVKGDCILIGLPSITFLQSARTINVWTVSSISQCQMD
jgi:hypothetical protein